VIVAYLCIVVALFVAINLLVDLALLVARSAVRLGETR